MSIKVENLKYLIEEQIDYDCEVWFDKTSGWMFKTDKNYGISKRLGYNYKQALDFVYGGVITETLKDLIKEE